MKKIFFTAAAVFAFTVVTAQSENESGKSFGFSQGDILVEGNLRLNSSNDKNSETKNNSLSFTPQVGYFISDKVVIGAQVGFGSNQREVAGVEVSQSSSFGAGVFGRYYFLELGQRFKTYADAGINFSNLKEGLGNAEVTSSSASFGAGIGINYFITERIVLNFGLRNILGYQTSKVDVPGAKNVSSFGFDLNGNIANPFGAGSFGVGYRF